MCLIGDIGGTNARFALVEEGCYAPQHERTLSCAYYRSSVDAASLAIATPVTNDRIVMTNHIWDLSVKETRQALGLKSLKVLNDFTTLALALPTLGEEDYRQVGGGIVPRPGDYFTDSSFRARFEHNSRFGQYLAEIPTYVINSKYPALIGAAIAVKQQYSHLGVSSILH